MAFVEDLSPFFDIGGFAINATLAGAVVPVIFDKAFSDPFGLVAGTSPTALAISADVAGVAVGDPATIDGTAYTVTALHPDGIGTTRLMLK